MHKNILLQQRLSRLSVLFFSLGRVSFSFVYRLEFYQCSSLGDSLMDIQIDLLRDSLSRIEKEQWQLCLLYEIRLVEINLLPVSLSQTLSSALLFLFFFCISPGYSSTLSPLVLITLEMLKSCRSLISSPISFLF